MATTPNYGWVTPAPSNFVTNLPADFETFADAVDGDLAGLLGGTTGQVLTKDSGTDHDFSWQTASGIPATIFDAKGDLIAASAADTAARLAVGTDGQVLIADSTQTAGLAWTTLSSGGYTLISTTSLTSGSSVTLSSIPSTYKHLALTISGLTCSANDDIWIRFNSDTGNNYNGLDFNDAGSGGAWSLSRLLFSDFASANADKSAGELFIYDYLDTTAYGKLLRYNYMGKNTAGTSKYRFGSGYYKGTSAISSINFLTGSGSVTFTTGTLKLYGIS